MAVAICACAIAAEVAAQRLPVRCYGETEGLVQSSITVALQDSRGFLWIGTNDGLSRFDGHRFINYGAGDGLAHGFVTGIAEDPRGRIWIATLAGLARFADARETVPAAARDAREDTDTQHGRKLRTYTLSGPGGRVLGLTAIVVDPEGTLWAATREGLYRGSFDENGEPRFAVVAGFEDQDVSSAVIDRGGRLWVRVRGRGLVVIDGDRRIARPAPDLLAADSPSALGFDEDNKGTLRVAIGTQLFELVETDGGGSAGWQPVPVGQVGRHTFVSIRSDSSGRLWLGTTSGLLLRDGEAWRLLTTTQCLPPGRLSPLLEDRDGNIWIAAQSALCRVSPEPLSIYTVAEGLPHPIVLGVFEGADGRIYVNTPAGFGEVRGGRVVLVPGSDAPPFRTLERRVVRGRSGDWWVLLGDALMRFPGPGLQFRRPLQRLPAALFSPEGLATPGTSRTPGLYEDSSGRLLVSTIDRRLYWMDPRTGSTPRLEEALPAPYDAPLPLVPGVADRTGTIWLSSMESLARLRNGRVERLTTAPGLPNTRVRSLYIDGHGRLWIGLREGGVSLLRDPTARDLEFVNYSTRSGLASDAIWSIVDDEAGRIYLATSRGLDRLDPASGQIRHFTTADGLPSNYATYCLRDAHGDIWVGTINGLARLAPRAERTPPRPPSVRITRIQVAGEDVRIPETGISHAVLPHLPFSRNHLLIEYVGVSPGREHAFRYQYRLDGISPEWSEPTDQRAITYAALSPGRFRFEVRAIDWKGSASSPPALVTFDILPPWWRRWWVVVLAVGALSGLALVLHQVRLRHALAVERIRHQVATDLHDDVGAGLSQIAILSEVARRERDTPHLGTIAELARTLRASMDDIVWAVDPRTDRLGDLAERIRQAAFNALEADGMEVTLNMPPASDLARANLGPNRRRHVLLMAKEAIMNVARHAGASRVEIGMRLEGRMLRLTVRDNGRGFVPGTPGDGQGLRSLSRRAAELGGRMEIESTPGRGTAIEVQIPTG